PTTKIFSPSLHDALPIFLRQHFAEAAYAGGEILVPPSEGGHDEVVKTADDTRHQQRFRLAAAFLARYKHLRRCGRFGEGVFAVQDRKSTRLNSSNVSISY